MSLGFSHEIDFEKGLKNLVLYYKNSDIDLNKMVEEEISKKLEVKLDTTYQTLNWYK